MGAARKLDTGTWKAIDLARAQGAEWKAIAHDLGVNDNTLRRKASERRRAAQVIEFPLFGVFARSNDDLTAGSDGIKSCLDCLFGLVGRGAIIAIAAVTIIDCGGLHDHRRMSYVHMVPSARNVPNNGFVYLKDGCGQLLTPYRTMTRWQQWGLEDEAA